LNVINYNNLFLFTRASFIVVYLQKIDGEALLFLSQSDLTDLLGIKLGPAIKIRNALLLIKETGNPGPTR